MTLWLPKVLKLQPITGLLAEYSPKSRPEDTFPERYLRIEILRALGELGGPDALPVLTEAMESEDEYTQAHAIIAAGRLEGRTSDRYLALLKHSKAQAPR